MERKNYPSLAGVRFLFIMMIVFYHCWPMAGALQPGKVAIFFRANGGNWGNYMFFMISGFLMTVHYKDKLSDKKTEMPLHVFLLKRLLKLYPLYFITMCASIAFNLCSSGFTYVNFKEVALNTLMISTGYVEELNQYNSPQWFACVLMLCYVLFYVLCYLARKNKRLFTYGSVLLALGIRPDQPCVELSFLLSQKRRGLFQLFPGMSACRVLAKRKYLLAREKRLCDRRNGAECAVFRGVLFQGI